MNKLIIDDVSQLNDLIITEDTYLIINLTDSCDFINIDIMENMYLYVLEFGQNIKNKIVYNLRENSRVIVNKIVVDCSDSVYINLNGENANITYNTSIINKFNNVYFQKIDHNFQNTVSYVNNHAINIENNDFTFDIDAKVFNNSDNCKTNQDNKIINFGTGKNEIKPNLLIDNNLIDANHSAYIGNFDKKGIFYLETRGISKEQIKELLTLGFLLDKLELQQEEQDKTMLFIKNNI